MGPKELTLLRSSDAPGLENSGDNVDPSTTSSYPDSKLDGKQGAVTTAASGMALSTNQNKEPEWAHGFQLFNILTAVTFVCFLMLLDGTIVVAAVPCHVLIVTRVAQLGLASGPLFGGLLTQYATWRWCFYLNLPVGGLVAVMLVFVRIPQQHPRPPPLSVVRSLHTSLDLLGFLIFAPALLMLLLALEWGGTEYAWNSSQIIGLFCGAGSTFIVFLLWDYHKGDAALLPFSIARRRAVWSSCFVYGLFMGNLYTASYWVPVYFQEVKGASPTMSGVYILPMIIAHVFAALSSGPIVNKLGYYTPVALFAAVLLSVGSGLISTFSPNTLTGKWIGYQILYGPGRGLGLQIPLLNVQNTVPPQQLPIAMALTIFSQSFGAAVFLSLAETIFSNRSQNLITGYAPSVNAQSIIDAGATGFRQIVSGTDLAGVLIAYAESIDRFFYLAAGMGAGCFIFAMAMGWKNLKRKSVPKV
ncbi:major facilitator superfamily domain-containing protein [Aspergillus spectabilis]